MILLDTHIWVWYVLGGPRLTARLRKALQSHEATGLGVSVISCWEVCKLVECGKLTLPNQLKEWIDQALAYPGIQLIDLTPGICVESVTLPQPFHRDPADQLLVATSRILDMPLLTRDSKILKYPHVKLFTP
ncbi:MAG TPA: type II toxin-antitoxin system VapC family toxin [Planctomycetota bacterium]|nr:type II toxin-antitoxin system VapC family toxin [Planctomycetota bacterium]